MATERTCLHVEALAITLLEEQVIANSVKTTGVGSPSLVSCVDSKFYKGRGDLLKISAKENESHQKLEETKAGSCYNLQRNHGHSIWIP